MSTKKEHLDAIKANITDSKRRLGLICDSSSTRDQQRACIDTTKAIVAIQTKELKTLHRVYLGRA